MEADFSSEVGAAGRLFNGCIDIYWALMQRFLTLKYKKKQEQALRTEFGRLYLWGDGFYPYNGRLDEILAISSILRNRVLTILVEIGEILCNDKTGLFGIVSQVLDDDRLRDKWQEVRALTEGIRDTLEDAVSSESESDSGSDILDQGDHFQRIIYGLQARTQCLIDLTGSLERPAADANLQDVGVAQMTALEVSGPAEIWTRKVVDTFPKINIKLAQRLGEANWQRYQRVSEKLERADPFEEESEHVSDDESSYEDENDRDEFGQLPDFTSTTRSSADPSSIFSSIGRKSGTTGTSVSGPAFDYAFPRARRQRLVKDLTSQATYTSFISNDEGERGWLKIPSLPKGAKEGKAFRCTVCGDRQKDIINWTEWKKHIFSDLQPYICLFADCNLRSYTTRKAWADHEFLIHRKHKVWVCNDCGATFLNKNDMREHAYSSHGNILLQNQVEALVNAAERTTGVTEVNECPFCFEMPGTKSRAFVMHVGRHMEEIALAVLPRDSKFEEDKGSISSNSTISDLVEHSPVAEKRRIAPMNGLPPGWILKRTSSGRAYSTDRSGRIFWGEKPELSESQWELEFCHEIASKLLVWTHDANSSRLFSSMYKIEENLKRNKYSTAKEFREAILNLEPTISPNGETDGDTINTFRERFEYQWDMMSAWLRQNKAIDLAQDSNTQPDVYTRFDQFTFSKVIGKGAYAKVLLAHSKATMETFAIKVYKKESVIEEDQVTAMTTEKNVYVVARDHPFIPKLISTFQTDTRLYFVLEYVPGGDLMHNIQRGIFGFERSRFYAAEVCLVLEFLHLNGFIYRHMKLDNILLNSDGHIKVVDFGESKEDMWRPYSTTKTFIGTPEFMAPEILLGNPYGREVDWWAFGVLLYQMLFHQSPFRGEHEDEIYESVLAHDLLIPKNSPGDAENLISGLLEREPKKRLGYDRGAEEIKRHVFFESIDWEALLRKEVTPPFLPTVRSKDDVSNFDTEFTQMTPTLTPVQSVLTLAMQEEFKDFSSSMI